MDVHVSHSSQRISKVATLEELDLSSTRFARLPASCVRCSAMYSITQQGLSHLAALRHLRSIDIRDTFGVTPPSTHARQPQCTAEIGLDQAREVLRVSPHVRVLTDEADE